MLQAMYSGVSGLEAHQQRLDVIGDNIANVNTTGFKAGTVTFEDTFSQVWQGASAPSTAHGGTNPVQTGTGVKVGAIDTLQTQGGLLSTSRPTDMALQGNGFFMLGNANGVSYTRNGSFSVDAKGSLVNSADGSNVLGWQSAQDPKTGVYAVDTTQPITNQSKISLPIGTLTSQEATHTVTYNGNLSADAASGAAYSRNVKVYDSQGGAHTVALTFTKSAANQWAFRAAVPTTTPADTATITGSGTVAFDSNGKVIAPTSGAAALTVGANPAQSLTLDFSQIGQVSGDSTVAPTGQDGFPPGVLQSFSTDLTGAITGIFSNGQTRPLGQIAVAGFANPEGLAKVGGSQFQTTANSGVAKVGAAESGGLGEISTGYLEQSNVDLSREFTDMIVTQRGFQANTKVISTVDQLLNDVLQMKP